jgi:hypothetical protein
MPGQLSNSLADASVAQPKVMPPRHVVDIREVVFAEGRED